LDCTKIIKKITNVKTKIGKFNSGSDLSGDITYFHIDGFWM